MSAAPLPAHESQASPTPSQSESSCTGLGGPGSCRQVAHQVAVTVAPPVGDTGITGIPGAIGVGILLPGVRDTWAVVGDIADAVRVGIRGGGVAERLDKGAQRPSRRASVRLIVGDGARGLRGQEDAEPDVQSEIVECAVGVGRRGEQRVERRTEADLERAGGGDRRASSSPVPSATVRSPATKAWPTSIDPMPKASCRWTARTRAVRPDRGRSYRNSSA